MEVDFKKELAYGIVKKAKISPIMAKIIAWRVENEYPNDLRELVWAWIEGRDLPKVEYNNISMERAMNALNISNPLDAAELLYVMSKDPAEGYMIWMESLPR
jgi:hypothetical protein